MAGNPRIDDLRKRLDKEPNSRLFAQLAEELRKEGELGEAIRVAREGLRKHPAYPSARMTLGRALLDTGDWVSAKVEFESVLQGAPDNILASRFLGECLEGLGQIEAAVKRYKATLAMSPGDKQVMARLAGLEASAVASPPAVVPEVQRPAAGAPTAAVAPRSVAATPEAHPVTAASVGEPPPIPLVAVDDESFELEAPFAAPRTEWQPSPPEPARAASSRPLAAPQVMEFEEEGPATIFGRAGAWQSPAVVEAAPEVPAPAPPAPAPPSLEDAERHFAAGASEKALEIYRLALASDPANGRLQARIQEIEAIERHLRGEAPPTLRRSAAPVAAQPDVTPTVPVPGVAPAAAPPVDRREALLRAIERLEGLLAAVERSRA